MRMKTIIAEKPSVAREIARIVGATKKMDGYQTGNSYNVTWAFGHLIQLSLPEGYGIKGFHKENLPILPAAFSLMARQDKTEKGYRDDKGILQQIEIIKKLFDESDKIIVATDAGREGELIFRYLYTYLGSSTPFDRLWISSLTDKAIRDGLNSLECGSKYDRLYYAAKARSEADWLIGINATQAISLAAGRGTYSLGRVQTPTLAMVCKRYWENKHFVQENIYQIHVATADHSGNETYRFTSVEKWKEKQKAKSLYEILNKVDMLKITKVEQNEKTLESPLLYDLTSLQKEANSKFDLTADQTLALAQRLYEQKYISYPRTGSRYLSEDVFAEIPTLIQSLQRNTQWSNSLPDIDKLNMRSVDGTKVTDHHALIITGVQPKRISQEEQIVYNMIVGRMLEAFSEPCVKQITSVTAQAGELDFVIKGVVITQYGWYVICREQTDEVEQVLPEWKAGDMLPVKSWNLAETKTKAKPLHTEASLLACMETAGKDIEDEALRLSLKDCGIGTPATRASIIETLISRAYMVRQKKSLLPTEKGLALYSVVKSMQIANVEMTGEWESALAKIERGEIREETFHQQIEEYTIQITRELLSCEKLFSHKRSVFSCPKCKNGAMQFYPKVVRCDNEHCGFPIFRIKAGKTLDDKQIEDLLTQGSTQVINGFQSKQGKTFSASIEFDGEMNTVFVFPEPKNRERSKRKKN